MTKRIVSVGLILLALALLGLPVWLLSGMAAADGPTSTAVPSAYPGPYPGPEPEPDTEPYPGPDAYPGPAYLPIVVEMEAYP